MIRTIYLILIFILILGCQDKVYYEKPEGLLEKEEMIEILYDMHLAVGTSNIQNVHFEKNRNYTSLVYEKYGIDSTRFLEANVYYTAHIQEYEEIFEEVERRITELKQVMEPQSDSTSVISNKIREAGRKQDSIRKVLKSKN
ncbi:MAG: DUF4296 domain-containing protein [Flavobacteriales bacterium]|nr:DUF4296 domain-containing protein [Flavobacteriales bacterium]